MSTAELKDRYLDKNTREYVQFPSNLIALNAENIEQIKSLELLEKKLDYELERYKFTKLIVIDNLAWLEKNASDNATAANFVQQLEALSRRTGVAILVLHHVTKGTDKYIFEEHHISGSHEILDFFKIVVGVRRSTLDPHTIMLKEFKNRPKGILYDTNNQPMFKTTRAHEDAPILVEFDQFVNEQDHLSGFDGNGTGADAKSIAKNVKIDLVAKLWDFEIVRENGWITKLTKKELADAFEVTERTIYSWKQAGVLNYEKPLQ